MVICGHSLFYCSIVKLLPHPWPLPKWGGVGEGLNSPLLSPLKFTNFMALITVSVKNSIKIRFDPAYNETGIAEYRIMLVPMDQMSAFDLEQANQVEPENFTAVTPSGSNISVTLDEQSTDMLGEAITKEKGYYAWVLSVADGLLTDKNALSGPSNRFVLSSPDYLYAGHHDEPYIHYIDIEPDTAIISPSDGGVYFDFDLNGDGTMDYQFLCYEYGGVGFGSAGSMLKGLDENNKVITSIENPTWIRKLNYGDLITFMDKEIALENCIYCSSYYNEWDNGSSGYWWGADPDNYTGLIMIRDADTIMGWMKIKAGVSDLVIQEYAWIIYSKRVQARFDFTKTDYQVRFHNHSVSASSFEWDFGDGEHSIEREPLHTYSQEGDYVVCLTAVGASGQDTLCENINICSLENNPNFSGIDLYPVPAGDWLMIKPAFPVRKLDAWLYDPSGRLIKAFFDEKVIYPALELDLSAVKEGIYILKLLLDDRLIMRKIIIMR